MDTSSVPLDQFLSDVVDAVSSGDPKAIVGVVVVLLVTAAGVFFKKRAAAKAVVSVPGGPGIADVVKVEPASAMDKLP